MPLAMHRGIGTSCLGCCRGGYHSAWCRREAAATRGLENGPGGTVGHERGGGPRGRSFRVESMKTGQTLGHTLLRRYKDGVTQKARYGKAGCLSRVSDMRANE